MTYFGTLITGEFVGMTFMVIDEKEMYLEVYEYNLPDEGYGFLQDEQYVYCVNWHDKEYCTANTTRIPLLFFYNASELDISLESCRRLEYTSITLKRLMCTYKNQETDLLAFTNDVYTIGDVIVRFSGNQIYSEQQFKYYKSFNPTIIIETANPMDPDLVWRYVQAIDDFLRLIFFEKKIALPEIRLVNPNEQYLAFYVVPSESYQKYYPSDFENVYEQITDSIPVIFKYVLNHRVESSFFLQYHMCDNMQNLFIDTYSCFDKLSDQARYDVVKKNEDFEKFKQKIWEMIQNDEEYEKVKDYIGNLKDKIMSHGLKTGHKEKLKKAFDEILKIIPKRAENYNLYDEDIANHIYELRIDIIHKGNIVNFSDRDVFCLEKLQWITYLILLRLIGIDDGVLEDWMNRVMGMG